MINLVKEVLVMATARAVDYGYSGGAFGDILNSWYDAGIFSYLLPFLLIFALVYGILNYMGLFGDERTNKIVNGIIAVSVGLMALQFHFVPLFFQAIFPRLGVALAIILTIMILAGFFMDPKKSTFRWILIAIGAIITIIVLIQTAGEAGFTAGYWWADNWPVVAGAIFILIIIGVIIGGSSGKSEDMDGWYGRGFRKNKDS